MNDPAPDDDEAFLGGLLERFLDDVAAGRAPDVAGPSALRPDLAVRIAEVAALAREGALARPPERPRVAGHEVLSEIGRGGMGAVYLALDPRLRRQVALKVLPRSWSTPRGRDRFLREVRAVARLCHPNVVAVHEAGEDEGLPWFTMEFLGGRTLAAHLAELRASSRPAELGPAHVRRSVALAAEIASALAHAHDHGVVHRDVKPSNVMLRDDGRAVLFDFGLADVEDEPTLTREGAFLGTMQYAAPEQAMGSAAVTAQADVWSLGAVLYEMLALQPPFRGATPFDVARRAASERPVPLAGINPHVARDVESVVLSALEPDPRLRTPDARAFGADLGRILRGEPVAARSGPGGPASADSRISEQTALVERAARAAAEAFGERPLDLAALREILGRRFTELGLPGAAREQAAEAYAIYERVLGGEAAATVRAMASYGRAVRQAGDMEAGLRLGQEAARRARALRPDHPARLDAEMMLAVTHIDRRDASQALTMLEATAARTAVPGGGDPLFELCVKHNLSLAYSLAGRSEEAFHLSREVYERRSEILGPSDPQTLDALLCDALHEAKYRGPAAAISRSEELIARSREAAGAVSPRVAMALNNHASFLFAAGRLEEAEAAQREATSVWERTAGAGSFDALLAATHLCRVRRARGDAAGAAEALRAILVRMAHAAAPVSLRAGASRALAECLVDIGRHDEAESVLEEAAASAAAVPGEGDGHAERLRAALGALRAARGASR